MSADIAANEIDKLRNEIARLKNQTNWVCKCGGTDCEGQRENADLHDTLDAVIEADGRAADQWRAAHPGRGLVIPDRVELVKWLLEQNAELRKDKERLEVERCECLRTMDLALNSNAGLREENQSLQTALDHQMGYQRELRADRDRLDWLDKTGCWLTITGQKNFVSGSSRAVIDAAIKEAQP